jgi:capsular polysaccharide biosynthesis protein
MPVNDTSTPAHRPAGGSLGLVMRVAKRWRRLVAATTMVGLLVGLVVGIAREKTYTAEAIVSVAPVSPDEEQYRGLNILRDTGNATRDVETVARLVATRSVAAAAARRVPDEGTPDELLGRVSVRPIGGSALVSIQAQGSNAEAAAVANAFAAGVTSVLDERLSRQAAGIAERLRSRVRSGQITGDAVAIVQSRLGQLDAARAAGDPTVSADTLAPPPRSPSSAGPALLALIGAVVGALAGLIAAFAQDFGGRKLLSDGQVEDRFGVPVVRARDLTAERDGLAALQAAEPFVTTGAPLGVLAVHSRDRSASFVRRLARYLETDGAVRSFDRNGKPFQRRDDGELRAARQPVIALPALDKGSPSLAAAQAIGRVALVARLGGTPAADLGQALRLLGGAGVDVVAVVLNEPQAPGQVGPTITARRPTRDVDSPRVESHSARAGDQ